VTWQPDEAFRRGLHFFGDAVGRLDAADWQRPSPCEGWRALDVLGHVGQATRFGTALLHGAQPAWSPVEPPGAAVDGTPAAWWDALAGPAAGALDGVDLAQEVDSPMGRRSVGQGLSFPALDLFVHAWDLGASAGRAMVLPAEAIEFARGVLGAMPAEQIRSARVFAAEKQAADGASQTAEFIAWTGRDPAFAPAG
jgi:uncharacterized protein (TIGR03086 family)